MPITIAEDNYIGEPGVRSIPMSSPVDLDFGVNELTDLTPIRNRDAAHSSGAWESRYWSVVVGDTLFYRLISLHPETPPDWATHIYKPLPF